MPDHFATPSAQTIGSADIRPADARSVDIGSVDIRAIDRPPTPAHPDWTDHRALLAAHRTALLGHDELVGDPAEEHAAEEASTSYGIARWIARDATGRALGFAQLDTPLRDPERTLYADVLVAPEHRGRGIGTRLSAALLAAARASGRPQLTAFVTTDWQALAPGMLPSPSGPGGVPADHPGVRFAQAQGMRLGQIERVSRMPLEGPSEELERAFAAAEAVAGSDYRVHLFEDTVPHEHAESLAVLHAAMATDAPAGQLGHSVQRWDAARVHARYRDLSATNRMLIAAVEHVPTGRIVAYNELASSRARPQQPIEQWDTLVAAAHRGRRLGMLVKAANLLWARVEIPQSPAVYTYNATENVWMLAVNDALGFVPVLAEGVFACELSAAPRPCDL